jgi:putative transposase
MVAQRWRDHGVQRRQACSKGRMHPKRLRRLADFDYTGPHRYSLTLSTFQGRSLFTEAASVTVVIEQILIASTRCSFDVIAYCAMPDHCHLVVHGNTESARLPNFMHRAKQLSGYHGKRVAGRPIWQPGYFDRVLKETEDTREVIAYVLRNPVRKGLVTNPADYPFSGSGLATLEELIETVRGFL